jgi:N-glycosylase/DNA lyase
LCSGLGQKFSDTEYSFPSPEEVAKAGMKFLSTELKAGYRAGYLLKLTEDIAGDRLDVESWGKPGWNEEELSQQILAVKGIGPYSAGSLLMMYGYFRRPAIDSWVRKIAREKFFNKRRVSDKTIAREFSKYGDFAGLALWLAVTKDWLLKK